MRRVILGLDHVPICWRTAPGNGLYLEDSSVPVLSGLLPAGEHKLRLLVNSDGVEANHSDAGGIEGEGEGADTASALVPLS